MNYLAIANQHYTNKEYHKAIENYKKSIENNEKLSIAYFNLGATYIKFKDYNNGIHYTKEALKIEKKSRCYFNLGYCYAYKKRYRKAYNYFIKAQELDCKDKDCVKAIESILKEHPEYKKEEKVMSRQDNIQFKTGYNLGKKAIKEAYSSKVSKQDKLEVLMAMINYALDVRNEREFIKYSKEYNELLSM